MCGILAILSPDGTALDHGLRAEVLLDRLAHRGPDGRGVHATPSAWLGHRRLAVVDPGGSPQPFAHDDGLAWVFNGEIYNHAALRADLPDEELLSAGDGAVIGPLWRRLGLTGITRLDGCFAFVAVDAASGTWVAARDPIGICPLYVGRHRDGSLWFASEMKALVDDCDEVSAVAPGYAWCGGPGGVRVSRYHVRPWQDTDWMPAEPVDDGRLRDALIDAVDKRLMTDVPWGVLLSGGLDSSLVAAIAARLTRERSGAPIHTFSIGLPGSPDLLAARTVARHIGSVHHEFHFSLDEALAAVPAVIWHLESFEQVRASVPMYLLAQRISALGIKVVLSGEGADEIFGGYLYFHRAPDARAFHQETVRKVMRLHQWDVLRANKAPMASGVETRVPFLDRSFVDLAMCLDPTVKLIGPDARAAAGPAHIEKHLLRRLFDRPTDPWLPREVLWRQKEQFSDGVGYAWVDTLRKVAQEAVPDALWEARTERFGSDVPATREAYYLRDLFEQAFVEGTRAGESASRTVPRGRSIACSTPEALAWDPEWEHSEGDISGRAVAGVHLAADGFEVARERKQVRRAG